jgi:hypothetical protein
VDPLVEVGSSEPLRTNTSALRHHVEDCLWGPDFHPVGCNLNVVAVTSNNGAPSFDLGGVVVGRLGCWDRGRGSRVGECPVVGSLRWVALVMRHGGIRG